MPLATMGLIVVLTTVLDISAVGRGTPPGEEEHEEEEEAEEEEEDEDIDDEVLVVAVMVVVVCVCVVERGTELESVGSVCNLRT